MECGTWVCKVLATWIKPKHRFKKYGIRYGTLSMTGYPEMLMKTKEENTGSRVAKCRGTVARRREPLPGESADSEFEVQDGTPLRRDIPRHC